MVIRGQMIARTATEALRMLWKDEFFIVWRQRGPIVEALSKKGNHFSDPELGMALMRAGHLTRRGRRGHYEYIQKFPFDGHDIEGSRKKRGEGK